MIFKTLAFLFLLYLLIKVVSRLFLPSSGGNKRNSARVFYQVFRNMQNKKNQQRSDRKKNRFDEIEEADFEEISEEDS